MTRSEHNFLLREAHFQMLREKLAGRHGQDRRDAEDWLSRYEKAPMAQYKVWDLINGEEDVASIIEACDAEEAAEIYAEEDTDGHIDGLYQCEHPIAVRVVRTGELLRFNVQAEMQPTYVAVRADD